MLRLFIMLSIFTICANCKKSNFKDFDTNNTPATNITATVNGRIIDELGLPIKDAKVMAANVSAMTDVNGEFQLMNATLYDKAAFVTVDKVGYFKGSRTFVAKQGETHYIEIQLIVKSIVGTLDAVNGGIVVSPNGASVQFPANSIVVQSTGNAYSGTVSVAMAWLNPTSDNIFKSMPGDLRGIDEKGEEKSLETFGMIGVELTGSAGEQLQIASGKKAALRFPIPTPIQSVAYPTIALWSFNEKNGLWKQEGYASTSGNFYEADVSHFSFWNCDMPFANVFFSATFKDPNGTPISGAAVSIKRATVNGYLSTAYAFTNNSGSVSGYVFANEPLILTVSVAGVCNTSVYTQNIGPYPANSVANLGTVTINTQGLQQFVINGSAKNCNGGAITNGYAEIIFQQKVIRSAIVNGNFSAGLSTCVTNPQITYFIVDVQALQQSAPATATLLSTNTALGNVAACGVSMVEYIKFSVNGNTYQMATPLDHVEGRSFSQPVFTNVYGSDTTWQKHINFAFYGSTTGVFPISNIAIGVPGFSDSLIVTSNNPALVNIVEYGPLGNFISGSFNANFLRFNGGAALPVQCSFRVKRY